MNLPRTNTGAALGGVLIAVLVAVLQGLSGFLESGQPWPETPSGWLRVLLPSLVAGLLATLTPYVQRRPPR